MPVLQSRWTILFILFAARTTIALQFQTVASTAPLLIEALALDFASIGFLVGLYMLPGAAMSLPGGIFGQRFGAKHVVLAGLALMALGGALTGIGTSFAVAVAGRLIAGTGAALLNVMLTKMVADWFAGREIVTAMAIAISSWPLGLALGLVLFAPLATIYGWQAVMHVGALCALAGLVLVALFYRDPPDMPAPAPARLAINLIRREWLLVCIAGAIWGLFNVAYIVLVSFGPELFTLRGFSLGEASRIVSLLGWVLIVTVPLAGWLAERLARPNLFMIAGFMAITGALCALAFAADPLPAFILLALVLAAPAGSIMALPAQVLRVEARASGMGVFFTCHYALMTLLPGGAGWARDLSGSPAAPALFAAAMMLLCLIGLISFHAVRRMP
jgi:predicted MFS family arabinose efflux permease